MVQGRAGGQCSVGARATRCPCELPCPIWGLFYAQIYIPPLRWLARPGGHHGCGCRVGGVGVWWSVVAGSEGLGAGGGRDRPALSVQVPKVSGCDSGSLLMELAGMLTWIGRMGKV
ncbi:hypothetical protein D1007_21528 [Hordeum vulgare]|nr:hypothetical protein D1007_21528 [Hordeum vulgare]